MKATEVYQQYLIHLADDALILGQRLAEWCGHGPVLEEDIALANISLDCVGQATLLYKEAARLDAQGRDEDAIALTRLEHEYRNLLLLELPKGDFAFTIARQFFYATYFEKYLQLLTQSKDEFISSFAAKALKEVAYHCKHARQWVLRLGDGTEESHQRMQAGIDACWDYVGEMFDVDAVEQSMIDQGILASKKDLHDAWLDDVRACIQEATLKVPTTVSFQRGGRTGRHTEHMGYLLSELQYMQRAYPGAKW
ncbi:MAG: 1,2-phenylacetyl-CoA epoxidase subunit PaaC [Flavobacteriales bacterium]